MAAARRARTRSEDRDQQLIEAARSVLVRRYRPRWHSVGAAIRGKSGRIYTAVNLNARYVGRVDVCAEAIALGMAVAAGERELEAGGPRAPRRRVDRGPPAPLCSPLPPRRRRGRSRAAS